MSRMGRNNSASTCCVTEISTEVSMLASSPWPVLSCKYRSALQQATFQQLLV